MSYFWQFLPLVAATTIYVLFIHPKASSWIRNRREIRANSGKPTEIVYKNLRMRIKTSREPILLSINIGSGHADFDITIAVTLEDLAVIKSNEDRRSFLHAALHRPFQLERTFLTKIEQRQYLDAILHAPASETEEFLSSLDRGVANGTISAMVSVTQDRDLAEFKSGKWFTSSERGSLPESGE